MLDENYLVIALLKGILNDKHYALSVTTVFEERYFDDPAVSEVFSYVRDHIKEYNEIPERDIILNSIPKDTVDKAKDLFHEIDATDFSIEKNYSWLLEKSNEYLKDRAMKAAILDGIDIIDSNKDIHNIRNIIENALCKDLTIDIGLNYFEELSERLKRILSATDNRVKTYYPMFDELFNGGYPPYTLNMFIAKVHGHKCVYDGTNIKIRNDNIGIQENIKIGDLYKYIYGNEYIGGTNMPSLKSFQNKHGEEEGTKRYNEWRKKISTKGVSKLTLFVNKYGEEEGTKRYNEWRKKNIENGKKGKERKTLKWYIEKYGKEEGTKRYNNFCCNLSKSLKGVNSLQWYINRYGEEEGIKKYNEWKKKISDPGRMSLPWCIDKYGEEEGTKRYNEYIEKQKHSNSKDGYINKHGKEKGTVLWNKRCHDIKNRNTLIGYINRYGEEEGKKKFNERQKKWLNTINTKPKDELERINRAKVSNYDNSKGFSKISQELFWILYNEIKDVYDVCFAELDENKEKDDSGINHEKFIMLNNRNVFADFFINDTKKIIEFDGDYWHGEGRGNKKKDKERDDALIKEGYSVFHIKEREYHNNCDKTIKKCLDFIYG